MKKKVLKPVLWRYEHVQRSLSDRGRGEFIPDPASEGMVGKSEDPIAIDKVPAGLNGSDFGLGIETTRLSQRRIKRREVLSRSEQARNGLKYTSEVCSHKRNKL